MTNAWTVNDDPFVRWVADLSAARDQPERLLGWRRAVLQAGEEQAVYRVVGGEPLAFAAREAARVRAVGRVAFFDREGAVTEADVEDLGELLRSLRPEDVETGGFLMKHGPPVDLRAYERGVVLDVAFALCSDIWLPWALGLLEDDYGDGLYDNRPLAERHTRRLNAFLGAARAATEAAGGGWRLDRDDVRPDVLGQVGEGGVRLDVERPAPAPPLPPEPRR